MNDLQQLDPKEKDLLAAYEAGEFKPDMTPARKKFIEQAATQTFKKRKSSSEKDTDSKEQ
jgi:hypothetical protein